MPFEFPSVTVCNVNPYMREAMTQVPTLAAVLAYFTMLMERSMVEKVKTMRDEYKGDNIKDLVDQPGKVQFSF